MSYDAFARYYDRLTANIDYPALSDYYDTIITRSGGSKGILLDLACGTGSLSVLLAEKGYDVIGADGSPEMLDIALSKPHDGIQYLCQDMTELDMFGTIDAAVCALDSLNHLESPDDVRAVFDRVSLFLNAGGVFVFDVNTLYKHEHVLGDSTFVYETEDVFCVWENEYEGDGVTEMTLDFFEQNKDGTYTRSSDFFAETAWSRECIESMLKEAGFELCAVYEYPTMNAPTETSEKLTFVAKMVNTKTVAARAAYELKRGINMSKIVRALSADGSVLCSAIDSTDIANEIFRLHKTTPVATAALGRLATAGSIMGAMLKAEDDRLTLRMNGNGPAGNIVVAADYMGNVKCYADNVNVDLPLKPNGKLDVSGYVGTDGFLGVIKDLGLKEPYATQVPIVSGEIAEDITSYYAISEQIPTVCALGVLVDRDWSVKCAGGFLIQLVPPINEKAIDVIEQNIRTMQSVTELMEQGKTPEDIALMGLAGLNGEVLDEWECRYYCNCSRERTEQILLSLGRDELQKLADEQEETEVCCHFCDKKYKFTSEELRKLLEEGEKH